MTKVRFLREINHRHKPFFKNTVKNSLQFSKKGCVYSLFRSLRFSREKNHRHTHLFLRTKLRTRFRSQKMVCVCVLFRLKIAMCSRPHRQYRSPAYFTELFSKFALPLHVQTTFCDHPASGFPRFRNQEPPPPLRRETECGSAKRNVTTIQKQM